jgi:hypothetical protein
MAGSPLGTFEALATNSSYLKEQNDSSPHLSSLADHPLPNPKNREFVTHPSLKSKLSP